MKILRQPMLRVVVHRPKLIDADGFAASALALLNEESRTATSELDRDRKKANKGCGGDRERKRERQIENTLYGAVPVKGSRTHSAAPALW